MTKTQCHNVEPKVARFHHKGLGHSCVCENHNTHKQNKTTTKKNRGVFKSSAHVQALEADAVQLYKSKSTLASASKGMSASSFVMSSSFTPPQATSMLEMHPWA